MDLNLGFMFRALSIFHFVMLGLVIVWPFAMTLPFGWANWVVWVEIALILLIVPNTIMGIAMADLAAEEA